MTPGSEGVAASSQKPRIRDSIHGISPSKEDDDDLVILGATKQGEGAVYDLLARDSVDSHGTELRCKQETDPAISLVVRSLLNPDPRNAFDLQSGISKWYRRKRNSLAVMDEDDSEFVKSMMDLKPDIFLKHGPEIPVPIDDNGDDEDQRMVLRSETLKERNERSYDELEFDMIFNGDDDDGDSVYDLSSVNVCDENVDENVYNVNGENVDDNNENISNSVDSIGLHGINEQDIVNNDNVGENVSINDNFDKAVDKDDGDSAGERYATCNATRGWSSSQGDVFGTPSEANTENSRFDSILSQDEPSRILDNLPRRAGERVSAAS